jgi:Na+-driven multidrug efflux pump
MLIADGLSAFGGALPWIFTFIAAIFLVGVATGSVFAYRSMRRKRKP